MTTQKSFLVRRRNWMRAHVRALCWGVALVSVIGFAASGCSGGGRAAVSSATSASSAPASPSAPTTSPSPSPEPPSPGAIPVPPPASFPAGIYRGTGGHLGAETLTFKANGTYLQVSRDDPALYARGTYTVLGNEVSILEHVNTFALEGVCPAVGTYIWAYNAPVLRLTSIFDPCGGGGRVGDFAIAWRRSP
jgi:hypothetical protein